MLDPNTRRIQHTRFIIKPKILTCFKSWVHNSSTCVRKLLDILDNTTHTNSGLKDFFQPQLVESGVEGNKDRARDDQVAEHCSEKTSIET